MHAYFKKMPPFGRPLNPGQIKSSEDNLNRIKEVETQVAQAAKAVREAGFPAKKINDRGMLTVFQRLAYLVDEGTWRPRHTWRTRPDSAPCGAPMKIAAISSPPAPMSPAART